MPLYEFFCSECGTQVEGIYKASERPSTVPCGSLECGGLAEYHVSKPAYFKLKYDQNGRVGFKYDMGNGKQFHRSATREKHEHTLGNRSEKDLKAMGDAKGESVYTKEYQRAVDKKAAEASEKAQKTMKEKLSAKV